MSNHLSKAKKYLGKVLIALLLSIFPIIASALEAETTEAEFTDQSHAKVSPGMPFRSKIRGQRTEVKIVGSIGMPTSESTVPEVKIELFGRSERPLVTQLIEDRECTGAYSSEIHFEQNRKGTTKSYFDSKLLWPEDLDIVMSLNNKKQGQFHHSITYSGETRELSTKRMIKRLEMNTDIGVVEIYEFDVLEKEK